MLIPWEWNQESPAGETLQDNQISSTNCKEKRRDKRENLWLKRDLKTL